VCSRVDCFMATHLVLMTQGLVLLGQRLELLTLLVAKPAQLLCDLNAVTPEPLQASHGSCKMTDQEGGCGSVPSSSPSTVQAGVEPVVRPAALGLLDQPVAEARCQSPADRSAGALQSKQHTPAPGAAAARTCMGAESGQSVSGVTDCKTPSLPSGTLPLQLTCGHL
jgi:hypothetical protein